ncbi:hypothetical protein Taro_015350 [Colocasia esculenta]|uniref:Aminotransferase-like plant mobile domain-containing protein n=1 Tax=Colocasia esculenta TaxID=4460 RepID=A0A843UL24_COLES|nr:hypothetical protein [Colocasia esculenta]
MGRMRVDPALTQALRSRWDAEATAFAFPWGHMIPSMEDVSRITGLRVYGRPVSGYTYPCYHELAEQLLDLPVECRSSLVPRVALQESLGLYEVGKNAGESEDEYLERLSRAILEDLGEVGGYAWGAAFLAHQFDGLSASERQTSTSGFYPFLQEAIDSYPYLDVVWQPYLGEGDEGQPWLVQARPYFGRSVWLHALNFVLPLHLHLCQRSLGLRQSVVEFPVWDRFRRPGRSFRGLHDTTNWREWAREQIENWERKGKAVKSDATTDDAYLQAYALKYGGKVYKSARHQVDVTGEIASLRALLYSTVQDREAAQRQTAELVTERVGESEGCRSRWCLLFSECRGVPSLLEARLAGAVLRAEEAQRHLEERGERDRFRGEAQATRSERDQLRIRAEAAEAQVAEMTRELAMLRVQRPPGDQEEIVTDIGRSRNRSQSGASVSRATDASVGQYLAGSSSRRRNEEEERRRQGEGSAQDGRGGGEMLPPPDRQEDPGRVAVDSEEICRKDLPKDELRISYDLKMTRA